MMEEVQNFLMTIKERTHVLQLIQNTELLVTIACLQQKINLIIKNGEILFLQDADVVLPTCEISGELGSLKELLDGKETLRFLVRKGHLKVSAPFRTVLLLESVFYLTKAYRNSRDII